MTFSLGAVFSNRIVKLLNMNTINIEKQLHFARLTLNRPDVRNAFDELMIAEITEAMESLSRDEAVRVVVITGAGTAFSAGADINWMKRLGEADFEENYRDALGLAGMLDAIYRCPKATIARVNGPTIGGGSGIVAACDIAVGDPSAFFSFSEVKIGLVPACIGPYVIRKVGEGRARELFISGRRICAAEAERLGLLNEVAEEGKLDAAVDAIVARLLSSGPQAIIMAKELTRNVPSMSREQYIEYTARLIANMRTSPEGREGTRAFLEKRKPKWSE